MAVDVSFATGADAAYPFGGMSGDAQPVTGGHKASEYYLPAEHDGEPAGKWIGEGLADLGIHDGQPITKADEELFAKIYGDFQDTRDPSGQTHLGSKPREVLQKELSSDVQKIYQQKLSAEPGATAERKNQLMTEARAEAPRTVVRYYDTTFSPSKDITLAHASALAAAKEAREAGDLAEAKMWEDRATGIWEEIEKAVRVYIDHQHQESGYVRTGHHGKPVGDAQVGRFERSRDMPVSIFPQHTSRNGDPQLHVHILWLNRVQAESDGRWLAADSRAITKNKQEGAAKAAEELESALSRRFGFEWAYDDRSKGRILKDFDRKTIDAFSSRRQEITAEVAKLVEAYRQAHDGREPSQRMLASMHQHVTLTTRPAKGDEKLDMNAKLREWDQSARETELGTLRGLADKIWGHLDGAAHKDDPHGADPKDAQPILTKDEERAVMAQGLARIQQEKSVWGRPELVRAISMQMPDHATGQYPGQMSALLDDLADRALRGEAGEAVKRQDAPEWPRVPDSLRREDGESVYTPHGSARYATAGQLSMEQRILDRAQERTGTRMEPEVAARLLGFDREQLETQLRDAQTAQAAYDPDARGTTGLRLDQAVTAYVALTSDRRVESIVAGAGMGKSFVAAKIHDAAVAHGFNVIGLTMTSDGRNNLQAAGVERVFNTAEWLGHLPGEREARGVMEIGPKTIILVDEATQISMLDWDSSLRHASTSDAKVVPIGDPAQLSAVEGGGGFEMVTRQLGYAQLTEVARFNHEWEAKASLALRDGDLRALAEYDLQGRLHAGSHEEMTEAAVRDFLADHVNGVSKIMPAYTNADRDELNRRAQEYLKSWGKVDTSASVRLPGGRAAHPGDLIRATQNDTHLQIGPGRTVSNGDFYRLVSIGDRSATAERQTGTNKETGGRMWSEPFELPLSYIAKHGDLGYARTDHGVQGDTVTSGAPLISERDALSGAYPGVTRGREDNHPYIYAADSFASRQWQGKPGEKPAPELTRYERLEAERDGKNVRPDGDYDAVTLMAKVMGNDGRELSATEYHERAMGNADHLGLLGFPLQEHIREESGQRFSATVLQLFGPDDAAKILADTDDLWRALRGAELAGKDGPAVLRAAAQQRDLTDARSQSAVLAQRVRDMTEHLPTPPRDSWLSRVPQSDNPDRQHWLTRAQAMDDRQERIGHHVAEHPPIWATQALGDVPGDPDERAEWEDKAGKIAAYRELYGFDHPGQAIGPEPSTTNPEARAEWRNAERVMDKRDGIDVRHLTDGQLMLRRDAYERETSWAPGYVAGELRLTRLTGHDAKVQESFYRQEAAAAERRGDQEKAALQRSVAESARANATWAAEREQELEPIHEARTAWEAATRDTLRMAEASDAELHRRGVLGDDDKLKSAEPEGIKYPEPTEGQKAKDEEQPPTRTETEERQKAALGLTGSGEVDPGVEARMAELIAQAQEAQAKVDELRSLRQPAEDPEEVDLGNPWAALADRDREAILQPPKPEIPAAQPVIEAAAEREAGE